MSNSIKDRVTTVSPNDTIDLTIRKMAEKQGPDKIYGIAVALDAEERVLGILTDGDIRRAYASGIEFNKPVSKILIKDPITVRNDKLPRDIVSHVSSQIADRVRLNTDMVRHVIVIDKQGRLDNVLDVVEMLTRTGSITDNVAVYGLGFIGLPLAVTLANLGHQVYGVDLNSQVRRNILKGEVYSHEPGLQDMMVLVVENKALTIHEKIEKPLCNVHIIAVGTPVTTDGTIDETGVLGAADDVGRLLKKGDLVQLRSTVPVGCTRERFLARLSRYSNLVPGRDFYLAFTPERTVEGEVLRELRTLPQVVGGYSHRCLEKAASFWSSVTNTIVRVESLEAAELVKLANNTFRDLSFGFANEFAAICDKFNLDAFKVIESANEGYPRDQIPKPSPGVGGYCLTKDPLIYNLSAKGDLSTKTLGFYSRVANERAAEYPRLVLGRWLETSGKRIDDIKVLCLGMSFKGIPETNDIRGSTALMFAQWITQHAKSTLVWDAVVDAQALMDHGVKISEDVSKSLTESDAIFILNNHPVHNALGIPRILNKKNKPRLVFDGWHQLDRNELERIPQVTYATMGYRTPRML